MLLISFKLLLILFCGLLITPFIIKLGVKYNFVDKPDERKVHVGVIPRLGGLTIIISFILGVVLFRVWEVPMIGNINLSYVSLGLFIIILLGLLDDRFVLDSKIKFIVQIFSAYIVVLGGVRVYEVNLPIIEMNSVSLGLFSIPLSVFWIVGIANAINLIDGLDGLSSGVSIISLSSLVFMSLLMGDYFILLVCLILIFSILGFMKYNFYPAKIFMGDTGSLFLGFMLGMITMVSYKNVAVFSILVPIFILAVPIGDTLLAIVRRLINKKPVGEADKNHLHHSLMKKGLGHKNTVLMIYLISILFNVGALLLSENVVWITIVVILIFLILLQILIESTDIISTGYKPFRNLILKIRK